MRAFTAWLGAIVCLAGLAATAKADPPDRYIPPAPSTCGPGYYYSSCYGTVYGPCYWLRPPFPPCMMAPPGNGGGNMGMGGQGFGGQFAFPMHAYARSPRDFFMTYDR
jgi:hypothetical protein